MKLKPSAQRLYETLKKMSVDGIAEISNEKLCELCNITSIKSSRESLIKKGLIEIILGEKGKRSKYRIN